MPTTATRLLLQLLAVPLPLRLRLMLPLRLPLQMRMRLRKHQNSTTAVLHQYQRQCFQLCFYTSLLGCFAGIIVFLGGQGSGIWGSAFYTCRQQETYSHLESTPLNPHYLWLTPFLFGHHTKLSWQSNLTAMCRSISGSIPLKIRMRIQL